MAGSKISLQDLIERFQLSNDQLNASLCEEQLREASRIVADHETLGPELGLTPDEMTAISSEKTLQLKRSAVLRKWKQKYAWMANYRTLVEALLNCSRADLAQEVCEVLVQSKCKSRNVGCITTLFSISLVIAGASPQQPSASAGPLPTPQPLSHHTASSTDGAQHGVFSSFRGIVVIDIPVVGLTSLAAL